MMNLLQQYQAAVVEKIIEDDPIQRAILQRMQRLVDDLEVARGAWLPWRRKRSLRGLYLYGPVGVGKTYLADLFYDHLTEPKKARFHFHHFMQQIDAQLRALQGTKDPLRSIAKKIAQSTRVLFFDEFLVNDVAYAMILAELLQALIREHVILIITSNTKPDDLYLKGVQRARFLPAIALINRECEVILIDEQRDYRVGRASLLDAYLCPLNEQTDVVMTQQFASLTDTNVLENQTISVQNRPINYLKCSDKSIWFVFDILCNFPRSQLDYLELANRFEHIFVSDVPCLTVNHSAQVIMFIHFIDVMYDRGIKVILSAAVPVHELYVEGEMLEPFKRTLSRLVEMQSADYLRRHPRRAVHDL